MLRASYQRRQQVGAQERHGLHGHHAREAEPDRADWNGGRQGDVHGGSRGKNNQNKRYPYRLREGVPLSADRVVRTRNVKGGSLEKELESTSGKPKTSQGKPETAQGPSSNKSDAGMKKPGKKSVWKWLKARKARQSMEVFDQF